MKNSRNASLLQSFEVRTDRHRGLPAFLLVAALVGVLAVRIGPVYYANKSLEADIRTEASRAGANFHDDETVMRNVMELARRNEVRITRENVKLERFAGQIYITITYSVPVDLFVTQRTFNFKVGIQLHRPAVAGPAIGPALQSHPRRPSLCTAAAKDSPHRHCFEWKRVSTVTLPYLANCGHIRAPGRACMLKIQTGLTGMPRPNVSLPATDGGGSGRPGKPGAGV